MRFNSLLPLFLSFYFFWNYFFFWVDFIIKNGSHTYLPPYHFSSLKGYKPLHTILLIYNGVLWGNGWSQKKKFSSSVTLSKIYKKLKKIMMSYINLTGLGHLGKIDSLVKSYVVSRQPYNMFPICIFFSSYQS